MSLPPTAAAASLVALPVVQPGSFLTLHYRLGGPAGDIINTFADKPATLSLGTGELSPAMEARLIGLEEGAHATFQLPAGEAFGDRNAERTGDVFVDCAASSASVEHEFAAEEAVRT